MTFRLEICNPPGKLLSLLLHRRLAEGREEKRREVLLLLLLLLLVVVVVVVVVHVVFCIGLVCLALVSPVRVTQLVPCDSMQVSHNAFQSFLQQSRKYFPRHLAIEIIKVHLYQASDSKTSLSTLCQERYD